MDRVDRLARGGQMEHHLLAEAVIFLRIEITSTVSSGQFDSLGRKK